MVRLVSTPGRFAISVSGCTKETGEGASESATTTERERERESTSYDGQYEERERERESVWIRDENAQVKGVALSACGDSRDCSRDHTHTQTPSERG